MGGGCPAGAFPASRVVVMSRFPQPPWHPVPPRPAAPVCPRGWCAHHSIPLPAGPGRPNGPCRLPPGTLPPGTAWHQHRHFRLPDLMIAATAELNGATVLHYDADYDRITGTTS